LAALTAFYVPSARNDFIYDDIQVIQKQQAPRSAADFARVFAEPHFPNLPYYRPVTRLTLLGQKTLHGDDPALFHLGNAALMGGAAVAAYVLLRLPVFRIDGAAALAAAALFALHPLASSTVYPISSGRETLLPSLWTLLAVYAFLQRGPRWYALALAAFAAALFSKEQSVVVPALFALADGLRLSADAPAGNLRRWAARYLPIAAIVSLYGAIRHGLFGATEYAFGSWAGPVLATAYALQTIVAPFRELVYEPPPPIWFSAPRLLLAAAFVATLVVMALRTRIAAEPATRFWAGWFATALLPTANLLRQEAHYDERYVFLASLGVLALAARLGGALADSPMARRALAAAAAAALVSAAAVSAGRAAYFSDDLSFSRQWLRTNPDSVNAHYNLAFALARRGDHAGAVEHYGAAVRIRPDYAYAQNNLGNALVALGRTEEGIAALREATRLDPAYADARHNLGIALAGQGKMEEATLELRAAARLDPQRAEVRNNLGNVLAASGRVDEAIPEFLEAVRLRPDFAAAHNNLANALARQGRLREAVEHYSEALRIQPDYREARSNLEVVRQQLGSTGER
jgi:tetratricopeptide (TPR) repeat protein